MPAMRFSRALASTALVLFLHLLPQGTHAVQTQRTMTPVDLVEIPTLGDPELSPDGMQILYTLETISWDTNSRTTQIWRINRDGSNAVQMTTGSAGAREPRWAPDGRTIALVSRETDGDPVQLYLMSNLGGAPKPATQHPSSVSNLSWSPDGSYVYFLASDPVSDQERELREKEGRVFLFDENYRQQHLWRFAVESQTTERLTSGGFSVLEYNVSSDGYEVALHRAVSPNAGDAHTSEIWILAIATDTWRQVTSNTVPEREAQLSPDNSRLMFRAAAGPDFEIYYNDKIFVTSLDGGRPERLLPDFPFQVERASWGEDGQSIYFTANMGVRSELFYFDIPADQLRQLTDGEHSIRAWRHNAASGEHVFLIDEATNPGDVHTLTAGGGSPQRVTHVFDYLSETFQLPRQTAITWEGEDGVTVEGLLYFPLEYEEGTRYPLVVQTHGGPPASDKFGFGRWRDFIPVLTAYNYLVFKPNYRGSTGYGDDFLRDMVPGYFNQSHLDVMTGVDHLIRSGLADSTRMVKTGWSAGGHMTNKIITFTNRFKAASSGAGAVNWISMYGTSDLQWIRTPWFGGTPWEKDAPIDMYWDHSPLKDIANVQTPTLILVGEADDRVPPTQSIELYRALRSNGVTTRLYIAPGAPHGWQEPRQQLFKINVELDWFERHVNERGFEWAWPQGHEPVASPPPD